jgi:two-component sensor histidine kinase
MTTRLRLFPKASIGVYLFAMVLAIALPILAFVAILLVQLQSNEQKGLEKDAIQNAAALGASIDGRLRDISTTLRLLATAPELKKNDLAAFHSRAYRALAADQLFVSLVDAEGRPLLDTRMPFGAVLETITNQPALRHALGSGQIQVSDIFTGPTGDTPVFNVIQPLDQSPAGAALVVTQSARDLARLVSADGLPADWSAAVLDSSGRVVSASGAAALVPGARFNEAVISALYSLEGSFEDRTVFPGQLFGYVEIPGWAWKAVLWGPIASTHVSFVTTWRFLLYGGAVLLAVSLVLVYIISRQVRVTIKNIAEMADRMGRGEIVSPIDTSVIEADQVAIALSNASFDRSQTEDRLHFVMHELVHRTKNLLALAQAMIRQLAPRSANVDEFQRAIAGRLQGLARSIELLTSEHWSGVSLHRVIDMHLANFLHNASQLEIVGEDFQLSPEAVQNLGLALHELATNSMKYGALSVPNGKVVFSSFEDADDADRMTSLSWTESDGPMVTPPSRTGFGTTVIKMHAAAAFGGSVQIDYLTEGVRWTLTAPRKTLEQKKSSNPEASPVP